MRSLYQVLRDEMPKAAQLLESSSKDAAEANTGPLRIRLCSTYVFANAVLLGLASCLNFLLRSLDRDPQLVRDAQLFTDEIISLVDQCGSYRPYGVTFLPDYLKMALASAPDSYRASEIEAILVDYEKDFEGAVFVEEAFQISTWLQRQARARTV